MFNGKRTVERWWTRVSQGSGTNHLGMVSTPIFLYALGSYTDSHYNSKNSAQRHSGTSPPIESEGVVFTVTWWEFKCEGQSTLLTDYWGHSISCSFRCVGSHLNLPVWHCTPGTSWKKASFSVVMNPYPMTGQAQIVRRTPMSVSHSKTLIWSVYRITYCRSVRHRGLPEPHSTI